MDYDQCFEVCDCRCKTPSCEFDDVIQRETKFGVNLNDLCHSNIGWFGNEEHFLSGCVPNNREGVYLLWEKNGYCDKHNIIHMRSLYVGKGKLYARLYDHWKNRSLSQKLITYWTFVEMLNRQAKYVEQLLLDLFEFPWNKAESKGKERLCAYMEEGETD